MLFKNLHGGSSQASQTFVEDVFSAFVYPGTSKVRHITTGVPSKGTAAMSGTSFVGPTVSYPMDVCFDGTDMYLLIDYGSSSADITLVKMNLSFSVVWQRKVTGGARANLGARVRVGESNNVYVGFDYASGNKACLGKWDSNGNLQWIKDFTWYAGAHYVFDMAVDSSGNSYIGGQKAAAGENNGYLVKFNSSGALQWSNVFNYHSDYQTKCGCVTIAANGNIIVGGYFYSLSIGGAAFIASFTSAGVKNWDRSVTGINSFTGICTDSSSNVYVTNASGYVVCYDSSGAYQSGSSFRLGTANFNSVYGCLQLGSDGYLYLMVSPSYNKWEVYRLNGSTILSSSQFVTGTAQQPTRIVVNGTSVHVLGNGVTTSSDGFVLKFDKGDIGNLHANFANGCAVVDAAPYTTSSPTLTRDQNLVTITPTTPVVTANSAFTEAAASVSFTNIAVASQQSEDSLVWVKGRTVAATHLLMDTKTMINTTGDIKYRKYLSTDKNNALQTESTEDTLLGMTSTGFALGDASTNNWANDSSHNYVGWTFRKAAKFFDVVTYTGNGSAQRSVSHALAQTVGMIYVKCTSHSSDWYVYYRTEGATGYLKLNSSAAANSVPDATDGEVWGNPRTAATSTIFSVGGGLNTNGRTYVAYLFAHDTSSTGFIQCGSFTGNGLADGPTVTLGWEPQYILIKNASAASTSWMVLDTARGFSVAGNDRDLYANSTTNEGNSGDYINPTATGFKVVSLSDYVNGNGNTMVYMAIRRGPMRPPTSGTQVFNAITWSGSGSPNSTKTGVGFPPDLAIGKQRTVATNHMSWMDRVRGKNLGLLSSTTGAEATNTDAFNSFDMDGFTLGQDMTNGYWNYPDGGSHVGWCFRRYSGVFDIVCFQGTSTSGQVVNHSLGVAPELIILKPRDGGSTYWGVYHKDLGLNVVLYMDTSTGSSPAWITSTPTASVFNLISSSLKFASYLFASKSGISKVGSYTGNGTNQIINCNFSAGARFILVKRTDSTGNWYIWDTVRGIVALNDPYLFMNSPAGESYDGAVDSVDPENSGFIVNQNATTNINVNSATYIYLAIA